MNDSQRAGALTMAMTILTTCVVLFVFQKILWLVVPGLLALMIYYCLRPLVERLVYSGVRHEMAVAATVGVVLVLTLGVVFVLVPLLLGRVGQFQNTLEHYLSGGQNLLQKTIRALEEVAPAI